MSLSISAQIIFTPFLIKGRLVAVQVKGVDITSSPSFKFNKSYAVSNAAVPELRLIAYVTGQNFLAFEPTGTLGDGRCVLGKSASLRTYAVFAMPVRRPLPSEPGERPRAYGTPEIDPESGMSERGILSRRDIVFERGSVEARTLS